MTKASAWSRCLVYLFLLLAAVGCGEGTLGDEPETVAPGVSDEDEDVFAAPEAFVGQEVSVTGEVARKFNEFIFVLRDDDSGGKSVLVVHPQEYAYEVGTDVRVEGVVGHFARSDVDDRFVRGVDPVDVEPYEGREFIAEAVVEPI